MSALGAVAPASLLFVTAASSAVAAPSQASLVGTYDGGQMEIAAGLELGADGRFRYALAYGALDEEAAGRWTVSGDQVLLTSDPVTAPRFVLLSHSRGAAGLLQVTLDVPRGMSRQYFDAVVTTANGQSEQRQLSDDGLSAPFTGGDAPTSLRMLLPVFGVVGDPVRLDPGSGYSLHYRFEPNDLGKVAFRATPLKIVNGELLLDRHQRTLRFRRASR